MSPNTAVVLVDPLNDFLHPDGKLYPLLKESIDTVGTVDKMTRVVQTARGHGIPIFYGLHQLLENGTYHGWNHMRSSHHRVLAREVFKKGSFGAEIHGAMGPDLANGDVVVSRHWNSSSFANTDLDYQLRQRDITHVICAGMVANTCLEATARHAIELGYNVTIISDATAGFSNALKDAAADVIWPTIADEVVTVEEWAAKLTQKGAVL